MQNTELPVGTNVTRKETGQLGKIVNVYSDNYIVELSDGDGYKHETRVVPCCAFKDEYSSKHVSSSRVITAAEEELFAGEKAKWTTALPNYLIKLLSSRSPLPLSEGAKAKIQEFATKTASDIAIARSGEIFSGAMADINQANVRARMNPAKAANENTYRELMAQVQGTPAEKEVTEEYEAQKASIAEKEASYLSRLEAIKPADYVDMAYMERVATALWLSYDIYPRVQQIVVDAATAAGVDPAAVLEQPVDFEVNEMHPDAAMRPGLEKYKEINQRKQAALIPVASRVKEVLKKSDELKAMAKVMSGAQAMTLIRLVNNINKSNTPAEILMALATYAGNVVAEPRTGTQTNRKNRDAKQQAYDEKAHGYENLTPYKSPSTHPEYANVSAIAEERTMLAYRHQFVTALAQNDMATAEGVLGKMREVKSQYATQYKDLISVAGVEAAPTPGLAEARAELDKTMLSMQQMQKTWGEEAKTKIKADEPKVDTGATGGTDKTAAAMGLAAGQPVRYRDLPAVHFIVSYDDHDPLKMYLIAEKDVNSHDRTELVEAAINDVSPLKVYNVDIGDLVDAFGTTGRVVDASAKDLGYVYAELKGSHDVVPVELAKTATTWKYAEPIQLCRCANDGGVITPGQEHNCPFIGMPMMNRKKENLVPPISAQNEEKKASIDLAAALDTLNVNDFPIEKPASEIYEDESNPIELGATVKKFGTMTCGIIVGFKRNCFVVDWENGQTESCWKQELVLVDKVTDAY